MPKPIVAIATQTEQTTQVANAVGLAVGVTAVVAVFIVIGTVLFTAPVAPFLASAVPDDTTTVSLRWTAPGDDNRVGQATAYNVRYSTSLITAGNFASAPTVSGMGAPKSAGGIETLVVGSLQPAVTYYFAVKTVDENGNWSPISNVVSHTTGCNQNWSCSAWSTCAGSVQTRTCADSSYCGDTSNRPPLSQSCVNATGGCTPDWQCSNWSVCTNSSVYRGCVDMNSCGTTADKPGLSQACSANICEEDWNCSAWTTCVNGARTRTCGDKNACGTIGNKPVTSISCTGVPPVPPQESVVITGTAEGGGPQVRTFTKRGAALSSFFAFDSGYRGGITVASGDVDGDGANEIVVGTGPNSAPHVKVFNLSGKLENQFFAYANYVRTGVDVAVADVNGDGRDDIITTPLSNGGPHVRVFTKVGTEFKVLTQIIAYSPAFRGGVSIAADDLNNDGKAEIVTVPATQSSPHVKVFAYVSGGLRQTSEFWAFPKDWRLRLDIVVVKSDGPLEPRIAVAVGPGGSPHVRIFRPSGVLVNQFFVSTQSWRGGVAIASADLDQDGWDELLTGAFSNGSPFVYVFKRNQGTGAWQRTTSFPAYATTFLKGIRIFSPR